MPEIKAVTVVPEEIPVPNIDWPIPIAPEATAVTVIVVPEIDAVKVAGPAVAVTSIMLLAGMFVLPLIGH